MLFHAIGESDDLEKPLTQGHLYQPFYALLIILVASSGLLLGEVIMPMKKERCKRRKSSVKIGNFNAASWTVALKMVYVVLSLMTLWAGKFATVTFKPDISFGVLKYWDNCTGFWFDDCFRFTVYEMEELTGRSEESCFKTLIMSRFSKFKQ